MKKIINGFILIISLLLLFGCDDVFGQSSNTSSSTIESSLTHESSSTSNSPITTSSTSSTTNGSSISTGLPEGYLSNLAYYSKAIGLSGIQLRNALHDIIQVQTKIFTYAEVWDALKYTDEAPDDTNSVRLLYQGVNRAKNKNGGNPGDWNREHTWPKSHGNFNEQKGPATDIHHLRATDVQTNSDRGNLDFDHCTTFYDSYGNKRDSGRAFEPRDEVKGDVARMMFYMAIRYEKGDWSVDLELNDLVNNSSPYMGRLSVLLEWNRLDPVDAYEMRRNERIYELQGNRNPFIDYQEACYLIWS